MCSESLPSLYKVVDPDALTSLSPAATDEDANWQVTFPYAGYKVTVTSTNVILVDEQSSVKGSGD
ncbi:HalOD1 output domain-containing protein [Natronococcus amylolyticus]|uniref:HalOD1 output domain-containing protein n=1 Tax=Natronococcus amylolyticus TaxID=44470 RepID=UPI00373AECD4